VNVVVVIVIVVERRFVSMPPPANIPSELLNNCLFELYRPYLASTPINENGIGTLVGQFPCGRTPGGANLLYSHILYIDPPFDIRDKVIRNPGGDSLIYADGDRVRVFMPFGQVNYVVVWVDYVKDNSTDPSQDSGVITCYLLRSSKEYAGEDPPVPL
jgi:hypothetical protein